MIAGRSNLACCPCYLYHHCSSVCDQRREQQFPSSSSPKLNARSPGALDSFISFALLVLITTSLLQVACFSAQTVVSAANTSSVLQDQSKLLFRNQQQKSSLLHSNAQLSTILPSESFESPNSNSWRGLQASTVAGTRSAITPSVAPSIVEPLIINGPANTLQPQQQKSLKFTLISGKYWKFNVKTNSLKSSHKEKELRLHRNISVNNFIIDDDGWFQYNHQQQQLFAWPSLSTEPATYYFVLLPSSLDYEADGENVINSGDVVANIVVELLPPLITGSRGPGIDKYIDHKFTFEYLHRHPTYPLLLSQMVSIFEVLARSNSTPTNNSQAHNAVAATGVNTAIQQNKQIRSFRLLSEYLLIHSRSTQDGEFFSLTWTTHPSLVNNTIVPIDECRVPAIAETISKLSSRSTLIPISGDKFVVSYSLEGPLVSSNSIIPTERGNYSLQLTLNSPCRSFKILEELGLASMPGIYIGLPTDFESDQKEKIISQLQTGLNLSTVLETQADSRNKTGNSAPALSFNSTDVLTIGPQNPDEDELIESNTASSQISNNSVKNTLKFKLLSSSVINGSVQTDSSTETISPFDEKSQFEPRSISLKEVLVPQQNNVSTFSFNLNSSYPGQESLWTVNTTSTIAKDRPRVEIASDEQTPVQQATSEVPPIFRNSQPQQQKVQPSAKSFVNFLDLQPDARSINPDIMLEPNIVPIGNTTPTSIISDIMNSTIPDTEITSTTPNMFLITTTSTVSTTASSQESSLNEDLIGILNELMEYLVSVAVPVSVILGLLLLVSILIALCNLCVKRRKSRQFEVGDRFKFRYGSERRQFLKNSAKPVILEADQKSLSMGGTPLHRPNKTGTTVQGTQLDYQKLTPMKSIGKDQNDAHTTTSFAAVCKGTD